MIVSKNWLSEYVDVGMSIENLTDRLTMSGLNLEEIIPAGDDTAIDLEVTSNRPDCLGHIGVAREISVLFESELKVPQPAPATSDQNVADLTSVDIQCPDLCHEYHGRIIQGVQIGPSPDWLQQRLQAAGINSVNNVVDVTNYVMLECGQPLHAFDFDKLEGGKIIIRKANQGEKIKAIDQRDYSLTTDMCVIADATNPTAVAGVMGGFDTEISDETVNVFVEAASFAPISVRATARALKLHSPSSFRFERRVDRQRIDWASRRCCELILQLAGGQLLNGSVVAGTTPPAPQPVTVRFSQIVRILGIEISHDQTVTILESLGLTCTDRDEQTATFVPPTWRLDLTRECDLIEEVARIYGYDRIPDNAMLPVVETARSVREQVGDTIRNILPACGFFEALTLSFVSEAQLTSFQPFDKCKPVAVNHSSRSLENQLRQSLIPSLLACRRQNERHGNDNSELFEIAKVYRSAGEGKTEADAEPTMLAVVAGRDFGDLKGIVEMLLQRSVPNAKLTATAADAPEFEAGRAAKLDLNGQPFGYLGQLSRSLTDNLDLQDAVTVAELNVNLLEDLFQQDRCYTPLPRFPSVSRDLNFVLADAVTWADLSDVVSSAGGSLLNSVDYSGQYRGKGIDVGYKSYLVTCRFQSEQRTLTTEEVDSAVQQILSACQDKLQATLR